MSVATMIRPKAIASSSSDGLLIFRLSSTVKLFCCVESRIFRSTVLWAAARWVRLPLRAFIKLHEVLRLYSDDDAIHCARVSPYFPRAGSSTQRQYALLTLLVDPTTVITARLALQAMLSPPCKAEKLYAAGMIRMIELD